MFYIVRERNCIDGTCPVSSHIGGKCISLGCWYEYTIAFQKPTSKDYDFVKINESKEALKKLVRRHGGLGNALAYLYDAAVADQEIDDVFEGY